MYCNFFGLKEKPFTITPNPRFLFLSKNHKEAFAHLLYGIQNRSGFIEVTGEVGTGKTTVLRTLFNELENDAYRLAFIFNPCLSAEELLKSINREYGLVDGDLPHLQTLNKFLLQENSRGKTVVLVIDEAQNLEPSVLEQIRLLSNLETVNDKLIQIVLVGQPELVKLLERSDLRQLTQRITVKYDLKSMDLEDTGAYIRHRLEIAGGRRHLFSNAAIKRVYRYSRGIPRLINIVCDRAMLVAYTEDSAEVTNNIVQKAIGEIARQTRTSLHLRRWAFISAFCFSLVIFPIYAYFFNQHRGETLPTPPEKTTVNQEEAITSKWPDNFSLGAAFNILMKTWDEPPSTYDGSAITIEGLKVAADQAGLSFTLFDGDIETLLNLGPPALLELSISEATEYRYLPIAGDVPVPILAKNLPFWTGRAYLLWRNIDAIPYISKRGTTGEGVQRLQYLLSSCNLYQYTPTGKYDTTTINAVKKFQKDSGIDADGVVGPLTLILLYKHSGKPVTPSLKPVFSGERS